MITQWQTEKTNALMDEAQSPHPRGQDGSICGLTRKAHKPQQVVHKQYTNYFG
jgi:hypothetical protein